MFNVGILPIENVQYVLMKSPTEFITTSIVENEISNGEQVPEEEKEEDEDDEDDEYDEDEDDEDEDEDEEDEEDEDEDDEDDEDDSV
jgi:hypothetical protein